MTGIYSVLMLVFILVRILALISSISNNLKQGLLIRFRVRIHSEKSVRALFNWYAMSP